MWSGNFSKRLQDWRDLRDSVGCIEPQAALTKINRWWFQTPWSPYYLHWDDRAHWPDPWQLLSDNIYCDVARGLGIVYTISMLERHEFADSELILTKENHNLVQIQQGKYILNWERSLKVNNNQQHQIQKKFTLDQARQKYK